MWQPAPDEEADPHAADELAGLREAIGKTTDLDQLSALAQAYAAVAGKLKEADPHARYRHPNLP